MSGTGWYAVYKIVHTKLRFYFGGTVYSMTHIIAKGITEDVLFFGIIFGKGGGERYRRDGGRREERRSRLNAKICLNNGTATGANWDSAFGGVHYKQ